MGNANIWNSHAKNYSAGRSFVDCCVCGNPYGIIRKHALMCCRQCFRSNAKKIGFVKVFRLNYWQLRMTDQAEIRVNLVLTPIQEEDEQGGLKLLHPSSSVIGVSKESAAPVAASSTG